MVFNLILKYFILCVLFLLLLTTTASTGEYKRANWLNQWARQANGLNTRGAILIRDGIIGNDGSRYWICPYTGKRLDSASDVDIDHVVSLKEAHVSGGAAWSKKKRLEFANDFDNLLAVYDRENRKKSSKNPVKWTPPLNSYWKEFARRWRMVKKKWGLRISKKEEMALRKMER